jgi:site-specific DNA-methyltransferase (adenine-specific)
MDNIQTGDIFQLGEHKLICGDSCNPGIVHTLLQDTQVSLVLTDPPYGVNYVGSKQGIGQVKKQKHIQNDQYQSEYEYKMFTKQWLEQVKPYLTKKNSFYIFNSDKMLFALKEGMQESGVKFAQLLIWIKNNAVMGRMNYLSQHELIAYGWYGTHQFQKSQDKSVIFYPKPQKSVLHPTMKPIGLLRRLILNSSKIGDYVYDPFGGSGSTLIACEQTKRNCLMIELDSEYCQTIITRWEKVTGQKAKKIERK